MNFTVRNNADNAAQANQLATAAGVQAERGGKVVAVIVVWVVLSTYYEFEADVLVAHSGPFSWRIAVKEISTVCESHSVRSGSALWMDRLEIACGKGRVILISLEGKAIV